jgi:hypothetical protein
MDKHALEQLLSSYNWWMGVSTIAVAVGILGEYVAHFVFEDEARRDKREMAVSILFGVLVLGGVVGEYVFGKRLTQVSEQLQQIAEAEVAQSNKDAAQALQEAESEKLARLKLEKEIAPRTLDDPTRQKLGKELSIFVPHFSGRKIKVISYSGDAEGIVFSLEVMDILTRAGIEVDPIIGRLIPVGIVDTGVKMTGPSGDEGFMRSFATSIHSQLDTDVTAEWNPKYTELTIMVGVKPVVGLPKIKVQTTNPSNQKSQ